jgi:hypothetical protein
VGLSAVLLLAACGSSSGSSASPTGGGSPSAGATPSLNGPLTVTRSGGVAGFQDRVIITADGEATVTSRGAQPAQCRVEASLMRSIARAVAAVDWASLPAPSTQPKHPDDLVVVVSSGGSGARLEDPAVKDLAQPVTDLLNDVSAPPAQRTLCRPL